MLYVFLVAKIGRKKQAALNTLPERACTLAGILHSSPCRALPCAIDFALSGTKISVSVFSYSVRNAPNNV
jgi:hypothetical protein